MAEKDEIHQKVVEVAIEIMAEKGYHGATIAEIANRADISRDSIYYRQRFKDKADILGAIFAQGWSGITEIATASAATTDNFFEKVERMIGDSFEALLAKENLPMLKVMLAEVRQVDQKLREVVIPKEFAQFMDLLEEITISAQEAGILNHDFNLDAFLWSVESLAETLLEVIHRPLREDMDLRLDFKIEDIKEMVLRFIIGCTVSLADIEQVVRHNKKLVIPPTSEEIDKVAQELKERAVSKEILRRVRQLSDDQWEKLESKMN
jgi:TetR/AcrR family fatty acid metabolism transcriptional regulator